MVKFALFTLLVVLSQSPVYAEKAEHNPDHKDTPEAIQQDMNDWSASYNTSYKTWQTSASRQTRDQAEVNDLQAQIDEAQGDLKDLRKANRKNFNDVNGPKDKLTIHGEKDNLSDLRSRLAAAQNVLEKDKLATADVKWNYDLATQASERKMKGFRRRYEKIVTDNNVDRKLNPNIPPLGGVAYDNLTSQFQNSDQYLIISARIPSGGNANGSTQPDHQDTTGDLQRSVQNTIQNSNEQPGNLLQVNKALKDAPGQNKILANKTTGSDTTGPVTSGSDAGVTVDATGNSNHLCSDQAAAALVKELLDGKNKNTAILTQLTHRAALKFNNTVNPTATTHKTLESYENATHMGADTKDFSNVVQNLYKNWGLASDQATLKGIDIDASKKYKFFRTKNVNKNYELRLNNKNASAILYAMSQQANPDDPNAINLDDVASVWAMEKLRSDAEAADIAANKKSEFSIGKAQGNMMNFSTLVYQYNEKGLLKDKPKNKPDPLDASKKVSESEFAVNSVMKAAQGLSKEQLKCLTGNPDCDIANVLQSDQQKIIQAVQAKLNESVLKGSLTTGDGASLKNYTIKPDYKNGVVNLNLVPAAN